MTREAAASESEAIAMAKRNVDAWSKLIDKGPVDAIIINASGCGTTVKDYGHMLADDPVWAERAKQVAALAKDVTEIVDLRERLAQAFTGKK